MKLAWIGLGKLGAPAAVMFAAAGHDVVGYDLAPKELSHPNLWVAPTITEACQGAEVVFVAVQTPHPPGYGGEIPAPLEPKGFDTSYLRAAVEQVAAATDAVIAVVSTVLPGTCRAELLPLVRGPLVYHPFFIAMGTVEADIRHPEFVLLGSDDEWAAATVARVYDPIHRARRLHVSVESAELAKVTYNCYSDDTEVMTSDGWKLFADLTGEESILSLNPDTHHAEWVSHDPVPGQDGHAELIRFWSAKDDILVTPNHNMFAGSVYNEPGGLPCDGENYSYKFRLIPAEELENRRTFVFTRTARWEGESVSHVIVDSHSVPVDIYARFMGWFLAEGCVNQHSMQSWSINVAQSRRARISHWEECRKAVAEFCEVIACPFSENDNGFTFYHKHIGMFLAGFGHAREKYVPALLKESPPEIIRIFLDAYLAGDGCDGRNSGNMRYYATTSDRMADDLGELLVKVGHMPSYRTVSSPISGRPCHIVYESVSKTSTRRNVERVAYAGKVYCTQLHRNHIMLTRRNGKCTWQGNTLISLKILAANSIMEIAEKIGADCDEVSGVLALATDRVVSSRYMRGGMGDGGPCHSRDGIAMQSLAVSLDLSADVFGFAVRAREAQTRWLAELVAKEAASRGLPVVVMGRAYKAGVNIENGSAALLLGWYLADCDTLPIQVDDPALVPELTAVYVIAKQDGGYTRHRFPAGSVVVDPWGIMPDRPGVHVHRIGRQ